MKEPIFSKTLFWDTNSSDLDLKNSKFYIIERVVTRGNHSDWKTMLSLYTKKEIKLNVIKIKSLDLKTLNFCSLYFDLPKEAFECYMKQCWTKSH
jgi:hypothetical protein